jgi:RNA recognition motif-containing protein
MLPVSLIPASDALSPVPPCRSFSRPVLSVRGGNWRTIYFARRRFAVGRKLYCGNLAFGVSNSELETLFTQFGQVQSAQVIMDRDTGRSKGFGFVEMSTESEAQSAIGGLNDREHDGRRLTVNEAKPRESRGGGSRGGYGGGQDRRY